MSAHGWFAGLMTGTVLDGEIDIALIRTDGRVITDLGPSGAFCLPGKPPKPACQSP